MSEKKRVLFICNHNAGRSQMGEALLNSRYGDRYIAYSAGMNPSDAINQNTIEVLKEIGIDISGKKPKHLSQFMNHEFDTIVLTCDCEDKCPKIPKNRHFIRRMFADPSVFKGSNNDILTGFRGVLNDISLWIDETFSMEEKN